MIRALAAYFELVGNWIYCAVVLRRGGPHPGYSAQDLDMALDPRLPEPPRNMVGHCSHPSVAMVRLHLFRHPVSLDARWLADPWVRIDYCRTCATWWPCGPRAEVRGREREVAALIRSTGIKPCNELGRGAPVRRPN